MEWMLLPLRRYAQFSGRARRKEYWMFFLFTMVVGAVLGILDSALGLDARGSGGAYSRNGALGSIFSLATLVPSIAVGVRRLHDTDRSGWWLVLPLVVLIVAIVVGIGIAGNGGRSAGLGAGLGFAVVAAI